MKALLKHSLIFLLCFQAQSLRAQYSFSGTTTTSATIPAVMVLSITHNVSASITFSAAAHYSTGYSIPNFSTVAIKSNVHWNLSVASTTANFQASGTYSSPTMPASVISLTVNEKPTGVLLSTTAQSLATGTRGYATNPGNQFNINFNANPGYNYGPGIYIITMTYTLTAQ